MVLQAVGLFTRYAWVFLGTTVETSGKTKLIDFLLFCIPLEDISQTVHEEMLGLLVMTHRVCTS